MVYASLMYDFLPYYRIEPNPFIRNLLVDQSLTGGESDILIFLAPQSQREKQEVIKDKSDTVIICMRNLRFWKCKWIGVCPPPPLQKKEEGGCEQSRVPRTPPPPTTTTTTLTTSLKISVTCWKYKCVCCTSMFLWYSGKYLKVLLYNIIIYKFDDADENMCQIWAHYSSMITCHTYMSMHDNLLCVLSVHSSFDLFFSLQNSVFIMKLNYYNSMATNVSPLIQSLSVCLSVFLPLYLCLSASAYACLSLSLSVCLSVSLSLAIIFSFFSFVCFLISIQTVFLTKSVLMFCYCFV